MHALSATKLFMVMAELSNPEALGVADQFFKREVLTLTQSL
jgi:hypothetical protein